MLIIVGLGNPGSKYAANRHNIGFMAVDVIHRRHGFASWSKKFKAEIAEGEIAGERVLLMKPQTFMNLSGEAVGEAMRFYKLQPKDITVIYDELDLPAAKARIKVGGGHGGHNGIKSMDAHCGKDYRRLRLGIGHPGVKDLVHAYVLGDFAKVDQAWLVPLLDAIADNADMLVRGGFPASEQDRARDRRQAGSGKPKARRSRVRSRISTRRATLPSRRSCRRPVQWPTC